jgi:hypothetical protein
MSEKRSFYIAAQLLLVAVLSTSHNTYIKESILSKI